MEAWLRGFSLDTAAIQWMYTWKKIKYIFHKTGKSIRNGWIYIYIYIYQNQANMKQIILMGIQPPMR